MTARDELALVIADIDGSGHFLRNGRRHAASPRCEATSGCIKVAKHKSKCTVLA